MFSKTIDFIRKSKGGPQDKMLSYEAKPIALHYTAPVSNNYSRSMIPAARCFAHDQAIVKSI